MIRKETIISVECDYCGTLMTSADGYAIKLPDNDIGRNALIRVAVKYGWKRNKKHWICPSCFKEGAE